MTGISPCWWNYVSLHWPPFIADGSRMVRPMLKFHFQKSYNPVVIWVIKAYGPSIFYPPPVLSLCSIHHHPWESRRLKTRPSTLHLSDITPRNNDYRPFCRGDYVCRGPLSSQYSETADLPRCLAPQSTNTQAAPTPILLQTAGKIAPAAQHLLRKSSLEVPSSLLVVRFIVWSGLTVGSL